MAGIHATMCLMAALGESGELKEEAAAQMMERIMRDLDLYITKVRERHGIG